ncbi:protease PrtS [Echria macrotheca]|uniref:Protease PrtS n=1 Tax=Echria macrotheca TaxID=438768 RepID=A0AAJ0F7N2_9PEZI|nr:protease PrtS [Echria macrotheca]
MDGPVCGIIPPYLLQELADKSDDDSIRRSAQSTLALGAALHKKRHEWLAQRGIVPDPILESIKKSSQVDQKTKDSAARTLQLAQEVRDERAAEAAAAAAAEATPATTTTTTTTAPPPPSGTTSPPPVAGAPVSTASGFQRAVYDMQNQGDADRPETFDLLPGTPRRSEGDAVFASDTKVNEAYDNALRVLQFFESKFGYRSLDNQGMKVDSSVHFGDGLGNAFWIGFGMGGREPGQMVYGDGNAMLHNFTACVDVIGHEMTHAVTQFTTALVYENESGALNEHISDVFGIMVKQMVEKETAENADWLIGEGCLLPGVKGVSLRNMRDPGTAYNDPRFGKDIQPAHYDDIPAVMRRFGDFIRDRDYGGVHVFSGIPNRAFVLAATAFGGFSWEKAGQIWWRVVSTKSIPNTCTFIQFADATVDAAMALYGEDAARVVRDAWNTVGVVRKV